jgi:hypothetical protein
MTSYCVCIRYSATETKEAVRIWYTPVTDFFFRMNSTGTCFIQKIYAPSSSLLQGKYLPFSPSPLRLNNFRLFVILSLTQLYRYTPEIFLFSTATFKYIYRSPLRRIASDELDKDSQRAWLSENLSHWNGYNHFRSGLNWFRKF